MIKELSFELPYPKKCSINSMYNWNKKGSIFLSSHAKKYKETVFYLVRGLEKFGKESLKVKIGMYPPDGRIRDVDNVIKITLDALQYSNIFENDVQIKSLTIEKFYQVKNGKLEINIIAVV